MAVTCTKVLRVRHTTSSALRSDAEDVIGDNTRRRGRRLRCERRCGKLPPLDAYGSSSLTRIGIRLAAQRLTYTSRKSSIVRIALRVPKNKATQVIDLRWEFNVAVFQKKRAAQAARCHCLTVPETAATVSLFGAALDGNGGAFRVTNTYIPNTHAIAALHPARMSDG
jgi:hypothetical protein